MRNSGEESSTMLFGALRYLAAFGNAIFFLWFLYNGVDSGFAGTRIEIAGWIGMFVLLAVSVVALLTLKPGPARVGIIGNVLGVIGVLYGALAWGLGANMVQVLARLGIIALLILNIALLASARSRKVIVRSAAG